MNTDESVSLKKCGPYIYLYCVLIIAGTFFIIGCNNSAISHRHPSSGSKNAMIVDSILYHSGFHFIMIEKDGITFFYEDLSYFNRNINDLIDDALQSRAHCLRIFNRKGTNDSLRIIYFNDREKFRRSFNMTPKGLALPNANALIIATNDSLRAYHTHELMHIISINIFGGYPAAPSSWLLEGVSVYADNPCIGYPIDAIAAYLLHTGQLPPLDSLIHHFTTLPDLVAYIYAGSLTGYIIEKYGMQKLESLWRQGVSELAVIIGASLETLKNDHQHFLREKYPILPVIDLELLMNKGCG